MSFHKNRKWGIVDIDPENDEAIEKLARDICQDGMTWTRCTAWRLGKYLLLNDSLSADGAGEWCVCLDDGDPTCEYRDIESITFSWCDFGKAYQYLNEILVGKYDREYYGMTERDRVEEDHKTCFLCA